MSCSYDQDITNEKNTQVLPKKPILTPQEYIEWSSQPNNLLIKEKTISEFNYKIKYLPTEQLVISELTNNQLFSR